MPTGTLIDALAGHIITERNANHTLVSVDMDEPGEDYAYGIEVQDFVEGLVPYVGEGRFFFGTSAPNGWLLCDGSEISRSTYSELFSIIGETYGIGDGSTTFNLPDLQGRSPLGVGSGSGLTPRTLGDSGGEEEHQLLVSELPPDTMFIGKDYDRHVTSGMVVGSDPNTGVGDNRGIVGADEFHNTMHPFLSVNFMIYTGVYV